MKPPNKLSPLLIRITLIPIVIAIFFYGFSVIGSLLTEKSDTAVFLGLIMLSVMIWFTFYVINDLQKQIKNKFK